MTGFDTAAFVHALREDPVNAFDAFASLIPEVAAMANCPQPANHHSEGSVWDHTRLALEMLRDLDRQVEHHAGRQLRAVGRWPLDLPTRTLTHAVSVLLHDVAKPPTRRGSDGSWTYYGHDRLGAKMAADIIARLGLDNAAADVSGADVAWLVDNHLFWLNTRPDIVTDSAVARRYVDNWRRGDDLRVLSWCDTLGSRNPDGQPHVELLVQAEVRLHATRERARRPRPQPPLAGETIMAELGIAPGPRVGAVVEWMRSRGLHGDAAHAALRDNRNHLRSAPMDRIRRGG